MPRYFCEKCNKEFAKKSNYISHTKRSRPCTEPEVNNCVVSLAVEKDTSTNDQLVCNFCNTSFKRVDYLRKHLSLNRCKEKQKEAEKVKHLEVKVDEMATMISQLQKQLQEKESSQVTNNDNRVINTDNSTHNTDNSVNITNNTQFQVVCFGEEDYNEVINILTDQEKMRIYEAGDKCIHEAVKILHCNKRLPQYQNIFNPNVRADYCTIITDTGLERANKMETMKRLVSQKGRMVSKMLEHPPSNVLKCDIEDAQDEVSRVYRGSRAYSEKHHEKLAREVAISLPPKPKK